MSANFFSELKRRRVFRAGVAYTIAGWIITQVTATVLPAFNAPVWVLRAVIVLLACGFPIALLLGWAYEWTSEGIRRTEPVAGVPRTRRRWLLAMLLVAWGVAGFGAVVYWRWLWPNEQKSAPLAQVAPEARPASRKAIAVLPFANASADPDNAFFAFGIQDEILTRLANIKDLKVISRTSTEKYKSVPEDLKTVGRQLGVGTVLEGSVQKSGDTVLINVQLIDTQTDSHIWAQSYRRELKDVFTVESEVAKAVAEALEAVLLPKEEQALRAKPEVPPDIYNLYLKADYVAHQGLMKRVPAQIQEGAALLREVVAAAPDFAPAWARLAGLLAYLYETNADRSPVRAQESFEAAQRALQLDAESPEAHFALGNYYMDVKLDASAALAEFQKAAALSPSSAAAIFNVGRASIQLGRWDEAAEACARAAELDPRNHKPLYQLGRAKFMRGQYEAAEKHFLHALALAPENVGVKAELAFSYLLGSGDVAKAKEALKGTEGNGYADQFRILILEAGRDYTGMIDMINAASDDFLALLGMPREGFLGLTYTYAGDKAKAKPFLETARAKLLADLEKDEENAYLHDSLGQVYAALGQREEALREAKRAVAISPIEKDALNGPHFIGDLARTYALLGEAQPAVEALKRVLTLPAQGELSRATLRLHPAWDRIRDDPAFQALLR